MDRKQLRALRGRKVVTEVVTRFENDPTKISGIYHLDQRGLLHRDPEEGPAHIAYLESGGFICIEYCWHGYFHREDGPAVINYLNEKQGIVSEWWFRYGYPHRDPAQGPAFIFRHDGEKVSTWAHYIKGYNFRDPREGPHYASVAPDGTEDPIYSEFVPTRPIPSRRWLQRKFGLRRPEINDPTLYAHMFGYDRDASLDYT